MKPMALGLGGGHLAGPEQSDATAIALVRGAIERGANFVDTSPDYGLSERRIGMALADGWRDKTYLQTKVGSHPKYLRDWSKKATNWSLENSFKMLQTEYVDSVLIHGPRHDIEGPLGECLKVMLDWKEKGRVGAVGVGVRQPEFHRRAIEAGVDIVLSFLDYTLLDQSLADETIPLAIKHDVGIIVGSPLGNSLLAGPEPLQTEEGIYDADGKVIPAAVGSYLDPAAFPRAHAMWQWCRARDLNIRHLAMQFAMNAPVSGNGIVLTGSANLTEFEEAYADATTPVPEGVWQEFETEFGVRV
jgi:aryl-alcohol dehydrogenase-like predicted oxidoreductase|tara:strand:+ start:1040 stop:1945 length:906 start_codon:yes stop_codon:yes gene_type:complete